MRKFLIMALLLLGLSVLLIGCRGVQKAVGPDRDISEDFADDDFDDDLDDGLDNASSTSSTDTSAGSSDEDEKVAVKPSKFETIADISEYWNELYNSNEGVINDYEVPVIELVTPGLCFITGVQYDILNIYNEEGRFEGDLMLAGFPAFVEKKGPEIIFGYEYTYDEEGGFGNNQVGDRKVENGTCDLDSGYYYTEQYTEREGKHIRRNTYEFITSSKSGMCTLVIEGSNLNFRDEESPSTNYIFIDADNGKFDFAIAKSEHGTNFDNLYLENDMTKAAAIDMFKEAGAVIEYSGGIKDGNMYMD